MVLQKYTHTYQFWLKQRKRTLYMKNYVCKFRNIKHENPFGAFQYLQSRDETTRIFTTFGCDRARMGSNIRVSIVLRGSILYNLNIRYILTSYWCLRSNTQAIRKTADRSRYTTVFTVNSLQQAINCSVRDFITLERIFCLSGWDRSLPVTHTLN